MVRNLWLVERYKRLGVGEFWVVDVAERQVIAFAVGREPGARFNRQGCCQGWKPD